MAGAQKLKRPPWEPTPDLLHSPILGSNLMSRPQRTPSNNCTTVCDYPCDHLHRRCMCIMCACICMCGVCRAVCVSCVRACLLVCLFAVPHKRQRLDKESSAVAAPAFASSSPQQDHIAPSASRDLTGPPAMGDDPIAEAMLLHTCPECGHTSGASEDQATTGPLRDLTESELDALLRSPSVPSGSDGPPFADTTGPHPHECCPLSWPLNDHEGLPTVFSFASSWYTGSSPDLEYSEEAAADFIYGSDSTQCSS